MGVQLTAQPIKIESRVEPPQNVISRDDLVQVKRVEKTILKALPITHHQSILPPIMGKTESRSQISSNREFFNSLSQNRKLSNPRLRRDPSPP
jgi:hypothetical protein